MRRSDIVHGVEPGGTIADNAALIVAARVQELLEWERWARDPARVNELHRMRIAAKRLRYTLELFEPVIGKPLNETIEAMKEVQELLGAIHDLDVLTPRMVAELRKSLRSGRKPGTWMTVDYAGSAGLVALCRRKYLERKALHRRFLAAWRTLRRSGTLDALARADLSWDGKEAKSED